MWNKIKQHWREIAGWIAIAGFAYYYAYYFEYGALDNMDDGFFFFIASLLLVLVWLRVNKR